MYIGDIFVDDRGTISFVNTFDFKDVKRFYQVSNHQKNCIRAWHGHEHEGKYIYVIKGTALVGLVNLKTREVNKHVLSDKKPKIIYAPPGFANGFKTLEEDTVMMFFSTSTLDESKNDDIRFPYDKWNIWDENYR